MHTCNGNKGVGAPTLTKNHSEKDTSIPSISLNNLKIKRAYIPI
jgi:hypothetical protein